MGKGIPRGVNPFLTRAHTASEPRFLIVTMVGTVMIKMMMVMVKMEMVVMMEMGTVMIKMMMVMVDKWGKYAALQFVQITCKHLTPAEGTLC